MLKALIALSLMFGAADQVSPQRTLRAETSLAGITIGMPMAEVSRILGSPVRVVDTPIKDVTWIAGEREFYFYRDHLVVKVDEAYYQKPGMQSEHSSGVFAISVQGNGGVDKSIRTGLGLSLGDSARTVRRLYGQAPQVKRHIQIRWANGNILDIDLDSHGKIAEINLHLNQE